MDGPGYWVFTPAKLGDGRVVMINRGFVPDGRRDVQTRPQGQVAGPIAITGVSRWPDDRHWFTPHDDPGHNLWFSRDPVAIAAAKGIASVAPFYVEQEAPAPPGGLRPGGPVRPRAFPTGPTGPVVSSVIFVPLERFS